MTGDAARTRVVIGIPTYRRPDTLRALLRSLGPEAEGVALIIVGDNACDPGTAAVVEEILGDAPHLVIDVPEPGVSAVRNALIRAAVAHVPQWEWLVMLDDDGIVTPGWLDPLIATGTAVDADVVGGPVLGDLPPGSSRLARNSNYMVRPRWRTGVVDFINGAQNIAIRRRVVTRLPDPWFDPSLGLVGGEDYDLFKEVLARGGRLAWCDESHVIEPTPPERLTTRAILQRAFHENVINARSDLKHCTGRDVGRTLLAGICRSAHNTSTAVLRRDADRFAATVIDTVALAGRFTGYVRQAGHRAR